ncbi:amidase signature domain-containing protein [Mycena haematopus]|nr:amidase signature domain-containing protein [Mycena haematopus]
MSTGLRVYMLVSGILLALCFSTQTATAVSLPDPDNYVQPFPMADCHGHSLEDAGVAQIQSWYDSGALTVRQVVCCYMVRIAQIDPYVNAVMEMNPDSLEIADELDQELKAGNKRGPMHGIVVLVKDNFATADKMQTTAGSLALIGSIVPRDAHVVHLLRKAGAVILGHAGMSEWADMRSTSYSEGYSARCVRNSYNLTQEPGGSSSGSGHSVSTNMVTVAFGTETDGSVISPAERANIVGIKPTVGLTSRSGIIPESGHQDTVGTFGRTVRDAAYALDAIWGFDWRDDATLDQLGKTPDNYVQFVSNKTALEGMKVGIPWERLWQGSTTSHQIPALLEAVDILQQAIMLSFINSRSRNRFSVWVGSRNYCSDCETLTECRWDWSYGPANQSEITVVNVDFYNNLKAYLSELGNTTIRSLEDLVAFNDAPKNLASEGGEPDVAAAFASGQDGFLASLATQGIENSTYKQALTWCRRTSRVEGIDYALNPVMPRRTDDNGAGTSIPAQAGYPIITVPIGIDEWHTPFGLSFVGTAFSEATLIKLASAAQDAFGNRRVKPTFYEYNATNIPVNWAVGTYL